MGEGGKEMLSWSERHVEKWGEMGRMREMGREMGRVLEKDAEIE